MMNMIDKEQLKEIILDFIEENFGEMERLDPCYNIDMLVDYIFKRLESESD